MLVALLRTGAQEGYPARSEALLAAEVLPPGGGARPLQPAQPAGYPRPVVGEALRSSCSAAAVTASSAALALA